MGKIFITRKAALTAVAVKMSCYVDNVEICKLGENESFGANIDNGTHSFKCKLSMGGAVTSDIKVEDDNDILNVDIKAGAFKPKVEVRKGDKSQLKEIQRYIDAADFSPTNKVGNYFYINETKKQWAIPTTILKGKVTKVYSYEDIISYELIEDGNTITKGGLGGAIAGGLLFGDAGAIVGGTIGKKKGKSTCTMLKIKITVKESKEPAVYINLIGGEFKKSGIIYEVAFDNAQKILSFLQIICDDNKNATKSNDNSNNTLENDIPAQIKKYKELLDSGAITQEEYDEKKKQLLGL